MSVLFEAIKDYLDEQEWNYDTHEDEQYLIMRMNLKTVDACTTVFQMFDEDSFAIYSIFPVKAPEEKRAAVAEFISRANYGLNHGNFELDFDDGEVRYKATAIWGSMDVEPRFMDRVANLGFCMLDRYGKGLLAIIYGNADPKTSIEEIENSDD